VKGQYERRRLRRRGLFYRRWGIDFGALLDLQGGELSSGVGRFSIGAPVC
jgi:hypothetical protein